MKVILIIAIITYVLVAIFVAQYMYTTVITELKTSESFTKENVIKFKRHAILSGIFFPISIIILAATVMARKRTGH